MIALLPWLLGSETFILVGVFYSDKGLYCKIRTIHEGK